MADDTGGPDEPSAWCHRRRRGPGVGHARGVAPLRGLPIGYEGCPLAPAAHRLVRECLIAVGNTDPALVRVGDYPSPTVLVNGTDVMRPGTGLSEGSACRIDVPTRERVLAALRAALATEPQDQIQSFHRNQRLDPPLLDRVYGG